MIRRRKVTAFVPWIVIMVYSWLFIFLCTINPEAIHKLPVFPLLASPMVLMGMKSSHINRWIQFVAFLGVAWFILYFASCLLLVIFRKKKQWHYHANVFVAFSVIDLSGAISFLVFMALTKNLNLLRTLGMEYSVFTVISLFVLEIVLCAVVYKHKGALRKSNRS